MDYDSILDHLGSFGRWQRLVFSMACLAAFGNGVLTMTQSFVLFKPEFRCRISICESDEVSSGFDADFAGFAIPYWNVSKGDLSKVQLESKRCQNFNFSEEEATVCEASQFDSEVTQTCLNGHVYDQSVYKRSLTTALDLGLCKDLLGSWPFYPPISRDAFLGMAYMIGMLLGTVWIGYVADLVGRIPVLIGSIIITSGLSFAGSFAEDYWVWFGLRLLTGAFSKGLFIPAFTISMEIVGKDWRMMLGILANVPFALGEMLVSLIAYLLQDWGDLQMTLAILVFLLSGLWFVMPESPRWLIAKNKLERARKVLVKGAAINGRTIPNELLEAKEEEVTEDLLTEKLGLTSLFSRWYVASNTLVMFVNWMVTTMCYYGLGLNSVNLAGDAYVNFALSAFVEIPSYVFCVLVMDGLGRKPILVLCQVLAGVTCVGAAFTDVQWLVVTLTLAGKFGASASFAIIYLYTAELYPTSIRNTAVGLCSTVARVGGILSPILASLTPASLPLIIMGGSALVGAALACFLPETLGSQLPESLDEVRNLYLNPKPWYRWVTKKELRGSPESPEMTRKAADNLGEIGGDKNGLP